MPTTRSQGLPAKEAPEKTKELRTRKNKIGKAVKTKQASQARLLSSVAESPLFKLSPEIRNMIYRFALVTDDEVQITKSGGIPEPALLSVSKIVRSETFGIFYGENQFLCIIEHYDSAPDVLAMRRNATYRAAPTSTGIAKFMFIHDDKPNWKNLVEWLHRCRQRTCAGFLPSLAPADDDDTQNKMLGGLFRTVEKSLNMTAGDLDILLASMRPVLADLHQDWAKD